MAFADGELDGAKRAEIQAAMAADPDLARRVEKHRALRAQVSGAYASVLAQSVPDKLVTAARGGTSVASAAGSPRGNVVQFPSRGNRVPGAPWRLSQWLAMAASLLAGVLISWRFLVPRGEAPILASRGAMVAHGALAQALDNQLASEQPRDAAVIVGLSFMSHDGSYCRSFTLPAAETAGLACRRGSDWQVPLTTSAAVQAGENQQAGSELPKAVLAAIQERIEGDLLDAKAESAARSAGWQQKP